MHCLNSTVDKLHELQTQTGEVIVAYSCGKDSKVVLDICHKFGFKINVFFMEFVGGFSFIEKDLADTEKKYGLKIKRFPHWLLSKCYKNAVYCDSFAAFDNLPDIKVTDVYAMAKKHFNCQYLLTGAKKCDSLWRRRNMAATKNQGLIYPIENWRKYEVLAYLKINHIEVPDSEGGTATGCDLSSPFILWLYDKHPEDFKILLQYFPYAEAVVKRREYYGVKRS